ncbi:MAG: ribonuclease J [Chloroflexi bacterium]|nr:ribonuclease J [Chloroflexota bacterium]MBT3670010.1 ribonuclease J [Chloroflexota bacterium]MBT4003717.1 ribonuclease J [Chloroflexota bacterium]MBT4534908.1 ribonuclease J [Chloroflexota bacterium]MBT4684213.1 ribonuclease J [Chloroflexota bacterium]
MNNEKLKIIPLGGLGEVGKNMMVYEYGDDILIVDTGIMFPENDMLGIDYIIPDFKYLLDEEKRRKVKGIVITHGHEDHTGAITHVLEEINAPIYATPLTRGLIEVKLARKGIIKDTKIHTVNAGEKVDIGCFTVEFAHVSHSIPDGVALGIDTPEGLIVHTSDYKFDHTPVDNWPTDYAKLAEWAGRGVLALLADSTNADKPGWTPSERVIDPAFDEAFRNAPGRLIIASFASNISRMQQVANACERHGRKMAFVGMSMRDNGKMARKLGYLKVADDLVVPIDQALKMKPNKIVLMSTGTQGEPTSILGRLATGRNRQFDVKAGDTIVLSSHPIPGNEELVYRTINKLFQRGANVIYDPISSVHVSGHASQEEIKLMLHIVKPKYLIPIHGELRHLKQHARMAEEIGVPSENISVIQNGTTVEFENGIMKIADRIPGGYVFVDGSRVGDVGPAVVREREALSRDGFVLVNVQLDETGRALSEMPEIITRGFIYKYDSENLIDGLKNKINESISNANGTLQEDLEKAVRNYLQKETNRRPMTFVLINQSN